ncbi:hypothetical protein TNCV_466761 [Trichonephila clavipes]|nr:hypothetical protein TNCV_466761 [Trichonephila clavipes]
MRGDGSGRLALGVYDGGHIGPGFLNYFGFMTNMVSLGDKVFILQFSRSLGRCGTAGPTNSQGIVDASRTLESTGITDEPQTSLAV